MDFSLFGPLKTGRLVGIKVNERHSDHAFIPNLLPTSWAPDAKIWPLIAEAHGRLGQLDGTGRVLPNPALLLRPLQRREAIKSNTIEGTFVTPQELLLFEAHGAPSNENPSEKKKDWQEVVYYDRVLSEGCQRIADGAEIDRELICALHSNLLLGKRGKERSPGQLRDTQVYVEAAGRYIPPPPEELEPLLANFETYLRSTGGCDPLVRAYIAHYQFEAIHPFRDGNGRIGRVLLSLMIYKWLKHSNAWLYMSEFFERNRREYITRLFNVSASGEWDEWVRFCLIGTIEQSEASLVKCHALGELKRSYQTEVGHVSRRMNWILDRLFSNPILEIGELASELNTTYHTARSDIEKLVEVGILRQMETMRPKTFVAHRIFDIAYIE